MLNKKSLVLGAVIAGLVGVNYVKAEEAATGAAAPAAETKKHAKGGKKAAHKKDGHGSGCEGKSGCDGKGEAKKEEHK